MPKPHKSAASSSKVAAHDLDLEVEDNVSFGGAGDDVPVSKKRPADDEYENNNFDVAMHSMLERFGVDISKTLLAKRKRLQSFTQSSFKSTRRMEDTLKKQEQDRTKLRTEFEHQVGNVLQQWEADMNKIKENEAKLMKLFSQQQKILQQSLVVMAERMQTVKKLQEHYLKGVTELEACHKEQQAGIQTDMGKEMTALQKKILQENQQQEMANVKRSLESMFY